MTTWYLRTVEKKNVIEREFWSHPDYSGGIVRETGWRWGTFTCESDEKPDIDLKNTDGLYVYDTDYEFEMYSLDDGCWTEFFWPESMGTEERERLEALWEEDDYSAWESAGLIHDDTEIELIGPLELTQE